MLSKSTFQTMCTEWMPESHHLSGVQLTAVCPHYLCISCQALPWLLEIQEEILCTLTGRGHHTAWCFGIWCSMFFPFQYKWTILCIWHMWRLSSWNGYLFSSTLSSPDSHPISKQNLETVFNICCLFIAKRLLFSEAALVTFVVRLKKLVWEYGFQFMSISTKCLNLLSSFQGQMSMSGSGCDDRNHSWSPSAVSKVSKNA